MFCPFHVNGSCAAHRVVSLDVVTRWATVTLSLVMESQPARFLPVNVYWPAIVMFCPFHVNGSCPRHRVVSLDTVTLCATTTLSLVMESQPARFLPVNVYWPAIVMFCPFHVNGSCPRHRVVSLDTVTLCATTTLSLVMESQPARFLPVNVYWPAIVMFCPFHVNGSCPRHRVVSLDTVTLCATTTLSLVMESQPVRFLPVNVYWPATVMFCPFHVNGSCARHSVVSLDTVTLCANVTLSLVIESQLVRFLPVNVYWPATVMFCPFHVNGSCARHSVVSLDTVTLCATTTLSFTTLSQPATLVEVKLY